LSFLECLFHRRFLIGELLRVVGLNDPSRQCVGNRVHGRARRGFDGDRDLHHARLLGCHHVHAIEIVALVVVLLVTGFRHRVPAGGDAIHL
jgi:hypothetical protein